VAVANVPILYISHSAEEIERLAQTVVVLDQGRVKSVGAKIG
jgi:molybdate transport system ATP-binding protein